MGFHVHAQQLPEKLAGLKEDYDVYAPVCIRGGSIYSDADCIRYGKIDRIEDVVFDKKSEYSFKEAMIPVSETLFYFTEEDCTVPPARKKGAVIFLRSCDLSAVQRLDDMYLGNGPEDFYYERIRSRIRFVLMGCSKSFDSCFCVSMGTNTASRYDLCVNVRTDGFAVDCPNREWAEFFMHCGCEEQPVTPDRVTENRTKVTLSENLSTEVYRASLWDEYNKRCINCGRCNFVCPTCTCFTMQDLFYTENGKVGERRRVWASCMVDGFTDVAGGGSYRKKNGERMRFKVMHKVFDYKERNGYHMCVGCGRCDDICPEYISFSRILNRLEDGMKEVSGS